MSQTLKQVCCTARVVARCRRGWNAPAGLATRSIHSQSTVSCIPSTSSSSQLLSQARKSASTPCSRATNQSPRRRHYSEQARSVACPTCSAPLPVSPTEQMISHCPACNAFLPPSESVDYYALFELPPGFSIDKSQLKRKFLQWQGLVHPDRLPPAKSSQARRQQEDWANMWSSIVNEGYKTLLDDRLRGEYILEKKGVAIQEEDKMEDVDLLMEIMEVREALEEAHTQEDVDTIREENADKTKQTLVQLEDLLSSDTIDPVQAKDLLVRLRYMNNVEGVCREWQPGKKIVLQH